MILVTGATGFIGSHLVERLVAMGRPVRCLVRRPCSIPGAEIVRGDLRGGEGLEAALRGVDCVIHLAGVTKVLRVAEYYAGNGTATANLVRAMEGHPARLVHVSSLAAVGPSSDGSPVDEDAPPAPFTNYGKSKLDGERAARAREGTVIVRPPVVYGPRDTDVLQLLRTISRGYVLEIAGGDRWFSAIYVKDLVTGLIAAAENSAAAGRTYFLTYAQPHTWNDLAVAAADIMGTHPRVLRVPYGIARSVGFAAELWSRFTGKPGIISREKVSEARCTHWTCSPHRAAGELGFSAPTDLRAGLIETLEWYKQAGWLTY
jgi:nucleoside-diphosphate-sugar epimerase